MKRSSRVFLILMVCLWFSLCVEAQSQSSIWVSAYYAGWMQGYLTPQNIDFGGMTHIMHFALDPGTDGSLDDQGNSVTAANAAAITQAAHAAGKKVLITVGGWGADQGFVGATNSSHRTTFIHNLVALCQSRNYDGIDIDWEPVTSPSQFALFIPALRDSMNARNPNWLLTIAATEGDNAIIGAKNYFDQINIMTYDMSGAWGGWVVWHNAPIYNGGYTFPSTGGPLPSADGMVNDYINAGVPASKLGIGMDFYGYVWRGVNSPRQDISTVSSVSGNVAYCDLADTYNILEDSRPSTYRWDSAAQAAYLSIDNSGTSNDYFVSYDDAQTAQAKINYVRTKGIGGMIIWELGGGYRANKPAGQRDQLLQAVKAALGGQAPAIPSAPTLSSPTNGATGVAINPTLSWNSSTGATSYGVQVSTSSNFSTTVVNQTGIATTSYAATGLASSTTYYWRVNATNVSGTSGWSSTWSFTTAAPPPPPAAPTLASPTNGATDISTNPTLSWNASSGATSYSLQVSTNSSFSSTVVNQTGIATTSYAATGLASSTTCYWRVNATNAGGTSAYSTAWSFTTGAPITTIAFRSQSTQLASNSASITIAKPSGAMQGDLLLGHIANGNDLTITPPSGWILLDANSVTTGNGFGQASYYKIAGASEPANYTWSSSGTNYLAGAILAYSGVNSSNPINAHGGRADASSTSHSTPTITTTVDGSVIVSFFGTDVTNALAPDSWTSPGAIERYDIYETGTYVTIAGYEETQTNAGDISRTALLNNAQSACAAIIALTPAGGLTAPSVPTLVLPTNGATGVAINPTLSWNASTGATSYGIQVSTSSSFSTTVATQIGITATSYAVSGLANNTTYYWRVNATNTGGTSAWSSSRSFTTVSGAINHSIVLPQGWSMISSFVQPSNVVLDSLLASIKPHLEILKNGGGQVYWPTYSINAIGSWDSRYGYQIYMQLPDTLRITGSGTAPESTPIPLVDGVNLVAYLRNSPMRADSALASLGSNLIIAKNNAGDVYWPSYGINSIGSMKPGQGYLVQVSSTPTLTYPANGGPTPPSMLTRQSAGELTFDVPEPRHYATHVSHTGSNAILLVQAPELGEGDEIAVWTSDKMLVGSGVISQGRALVTVWGDNIATTAIRDGAVDGEPLSLTAWSLVDSKEGSLSITSVTDFLNGALSGNVLQYKTDAVWVTTVKKIEEIPESFSLSQNYPNPFNPSSVIKYSLPNTAWVRLEVFNLIGQEIAVLVNEEQKAGNHEVIFQNPGLGSGVYFYRLTAGKLTDTRKMIIVR
jgi:chitinase